MDAQEIKKTRKEILVKAEEILNFNFEINRDAVEVFFYLYDQYFFQKEITKKLEESSKNNSNDYFEIYPYFVFGASERNSGYGSTSGFYFEKVKTTHGYRYVKYYFIDISPSILETIEISTNKKGMPKAAGIGCDSKFRCFALIMEHEIIHLLTTLWEFDTPLLRKRNYKIYGPHGALFSCALNKFFGHTEHSHNLSLEGIKLKDYRDKITVPKTGFVNWQNSCYLDSVLMVLLNNKFGFWRDVLFNGDIDSESDPSSKIEIATKIRRALHSDYEKITSGQENIKCVKVRELFGTHDPLMYERKGEYIRWNMYEPGSFYANLVQLFPKMKIDMPYRLVRKFDVTVEESMRYKKEYAFTVADFVFPSESNTDEDYKELLWNEVASPVLVFTHQGVPKIKNFDTVNEGKIRALGPEILNGKYKLVGVVTLLGRIGEQGGGDHYISYFLASDNYWYYYNDMRHKIEKIGSVNDLPEKGVWEQSSTEMPTLFFYALKTPIQNIVEKPYTTIETRKLKALRLNRPDNGVLFKIRFKKENFNIEKIEKFMEAIDKHSVMNIENKDDEKYYILRFNSVEIGDVFEKFLEEL